MGLCVSAEENANKEMNKKLSKNSKEIKLTQKLLLLGAGEAGKSTVFKQVKIVFQEGFDHEAKMSFVQPVYGNAIEGIKTLVYQARRKTTEFSDKGKKLADLVMDLPLNAELNSALGDKIKYLWTNEQAIKEVYSDQSWGYLSDSTGHMLDSIDRIAASGYVPSDQDIVKCRVRTSGIEEMNFFIGKVKFQIVDVGGQENERRKWIYAFDEVVAVIFVAAISEYDKCMQENEKKNRLQDSIDLFGKICNSENFKQTPMILFLNKRDLFQDKFERKESPLESFFPDYDGGWDSDEGIQFVVGKFLDVQEEANRVKEDGQGNQQEIFFHVTCATDPNNIEIVFEAVHDTVLRKNLEYSQLA